MSAPIVTLTDIKTFLGKTGTDDDVLIASIASNATAMAERDTGRTFSVTSNTTLTYSTDGQRAITIHDRPFTDGSRTVQLAGTTLTEGTNVWFLQDRRNPAVTTMVQLGAFSSEWFAHSFAWFDQNWDRFPYGSGASGTANDLVLGGVIGHPQVTDDVRQGVLELAAWLYWRAKGGVSSFAETLTGTDVDLSLLPMAYQVMVRNWKVHTFVAGV